MENKPLWKSVLFHISALLVGALFIYSGFVKAIDPLGTVYKIQDYLEVMHLEIFNPLAIAASFGLFTLEFVAGTLLLIRINLPAGLWIATILMTAMTPLTLWIAVADPVSDCGCFGDALIISNWATFWKNIVIDMLLILMWLWRKQCYRQWLTKLPSWITTATIAVIIIGFGIHAINNLPVIDFRPYKTGTDIIGAMQLPEGAKPDIYETTFIYSRDGEERPFSLQDAPYNDSAWTFVSQNTRLVEKGDEPPIHDFSIATPEGDDITYDILGSDGRYYIAVMYDLAKTNLKSLANVDSLYRQALEEGAGFIALTASADMIDEFRERHNIRYDFALTDPIQLKTMVRANPGIVVLEGSVIADKFNPNWCHYRRRNGNHQEVSGKSAARQANM